MEYKTSSFWTTPQGLVALIFIGFVSYFLLMEHREHLFQWLPFLIILACPLMHIYMHGSHGESSSHDHQGDGHVYQGDLEEGRRQQVEVEKRSDSNE